MTDTTCNMMTFQFQLAATASPSMPQIIYFMGAVRLGHRPDFNANLGANLRTVAGLTNTA